ncbi:MAG: tetratricopeptide repeat protein [Treponema sp.]|jgi:tetratricopeptide (TPR) repeat protein|nr:tetratricopeptide repeat protein [Treponema sp.]
MKHVGMPILVGGGIFFFAALPLLYSQTRVQGLGAAAYYETGRRSMSQENWYAATEALLECLRLNPAHAEGSAALAECYYELGEFDQALVWVRKARSLSRGNLVLANLEAFTLIALGRLEEASSVITEVLTREPYNKEALFAASEMDIARGRPGDAVTRYREAVRRYPDDRRLLISLALVLGSLGDTETARTYIDRAVVQHPEDYRVYYYAAYLDAQAGRLGSAIQYAEYALAYRPGYGPAFSLLASLRYRSGQYEEASRLADEAISLNRDDISAWYLKGMSYIRMGRHAEAITVLATASTIDPTDEFVRAALEELIISGTALEDSRRSSWATWHFNRGRDFRSRNLIEQALFEYRRGLRLNPYALDRQEYADLLRVQGYPARYLEELRFMQTLGLGDRSLKDAVEAYDALLDEAIYRRWSVNPVDIAKRHWRVAVFSLVSQASSYHVDAGATAASYIKDILTHDRNIAPMPLEVPQTSFSQSFRLARETEADYFLIISVTENERDMAIKGELFVGRTGSPAGEFYAYRTGADRLRNASRGIVDQFTAQLPFRGELLAHKQSQGLIDKGRADGVKADTLYAVVKKGQVLIRSEGIGLTYSPEDVVGTLVIETADEEVASGSLSRNGFFDRIAPGDAIILQSPDTENTNPPDPPLADPELRALLWTLR